VLDIQQDLTRLLTSQSEIAVRQWPVQDAKARFSEMLDACLKDGPQIVSKRGEAKAVLVPLGEWQRLRQNHQTLKQLLLAPEPRFELDMPDRRAWKLRDLPDLE